MEGCRQCPVCLKKACAVFRAQHLVLGVANQILQEEIHRVTKQKEKPVFNAGPTGERKVHEGSNETIPLKRKL